MEQCEETYVAREDDCGPCYGATQDEVACCNTCEALSKVMRANLKAEGCVAKCLFCLKAFRMMTWPFDPGMYDQCKGGGIDGGIYIPHAGDDVV